MSVGPLSLEAAIGEEQARRRNLQHAGTPFHYWQARGDAEAPRDEYWCDHCVGFYGVPHDWAHLEPVCRYAWGPHVCACIDCQVARALREVEATT